MKLLGTIWREVLGIFVDDARFAVAILAWLLLAWLGTRLLHIPSGIAGALLALGFVVILLESAASRARK